MVEAMHELNLGALEQTDSGQWPPSNARAQT
jgi:hypothetical protein